MTRQLPVKQTSKPLSAVDMYPPFVHCMRRKILWGSKIVQDPPSVGYEEVMASDGYGLYKWLSKIVQHLHIPLASLLFTFLLHLGQVRLLLRFWGPTDNSCHGRTFTTYRFYPRNTL